MTLQQITAHLLSVGFTAKTKALFRRGPVDVEIKDAFLKIKHPEMINLPDPFLRVKVYGPGSERYAQFDCALDSFQIFENSQL